ncbi:hypothetical protein [Alicyclobacillus shizuokensis]|uniref:hypothetical protein n=1 Tax=Alicyclobacillus shizuokensis TaxID=392014 RepID=UPI00083274F4|nr:hypothetical protein [Alicyclobacillus shizuokensis]
MNPDAQKSSLNGARQGAGAAAWCPACGRPLTDKQSLVVEYWRADEVIYDCYCSKCEWNGEIVVGPRVVIAEYAD